MSHPTWVRGLKLNNDIKFGKCGWSHPTWVRGLKQRCACIGWQDVRVAPYVGAWIETNKARIAFACVVVAPYVGAWIETSFQKEL